jgi:surfactin synthase thioesterase subunit
LFKLNSIVLNKSKDKSIIFLHGFYANAGYWLPYVSAFQEYKLVLLNLDYGSILQSEVLLNQAIVEIEHLALSINVKAIVGHSLGTIISNKIDLKGIARYDICPVGYADRIDSNQFISDIHSLVGHSKSEIKNNLELLDQLFPLLIASNSPNTYKYIPTSDRYFSYHNKGENFVIFDGDHFDVINAIEEIVGKIN